MADKAELPTHLFEEPQSWETWLGENGTVSKGVWLKMAKKDSGCVSITYAEALDIALCYGWIDSQKAAFDAQYWVQRFTPRGPKSIWSKINCEHIARLTAAGKMQAEGLRQVELAQRDGRWDAAYASQRNATVPEDFQQELDKNPAALEFFATLKSANRYAILFRIETAKKAETRAARIQTFIAMLTRHEKLHP